MLKLVYREYKLLICKTDTYRGREKDKEEVYKVVNHQEVNNVKWYKVK